MFSVRLRAQLGLLAAFVVLAAAVATLLIRPRVTKPVAVADVGTLAPDFQLEDVDGRTFTLSRHRGQALVMFFGSVNCPRTADYNARVERLARSYTRDPRVKFVAVDVTARGRQVIDRQALRLDPAVAARTFATLVDVNGVVAHRYSALQTPTFVVLDGHGVVRYRGPFDNSQDIAYATQRFCADALGEVLGVNAPTSAFASGVIRP
jgi:cytochrome oxidase Cu insertion factor (SCO1/SenC/PrrC family)